LMYVSERNFCEFDSSEGEDDNNNMPMLTIG
jgi:hypothetical protein